MSVDRRSYGAPGVPTIMIVDDSTATRRILSRILTDAGYRTVEAGDGLSALEACRSSAP